MAVVLRQDGLKRAGWRNRAHAALLLGGMSAVLALCVWLVGGGSALLSAALVIAAGLVVMPALSPAMIMRLHRAVPVPARQVPELALNLADIARRAGLSAVPDLYWLPDRGINAVAVGGATRSAIGLSDGAFRSLTLREMRAVLAHEVTHIAAGDTRLLRLTGVIAQLTRWTALFGLLTCLVLLVFLGAVGVSWWTVAALGVASPLVALLELAFWRNREFAADLGGVTLTGDPMGLVAALDRIDNLERRNWPWLMGRVAPLPPPLLLRTHPPTGERVGRLLEHVRLTQPALTDVTNLEVLTGLMPVAWGPPPRPPAWGPPPAPPAWGPPPAPPAGAANDLRRSVAARGHRHDGLR